MGLFLKPEKTNLIGLLDQCLLKLRMPVKVEDAIVFLKDNNKNGWVNLNVNTSKSGKKYVELDTFEPTKKTEDLF